MQSTGKDKARHKFSVSELKAIAVHKYFLSQKAGHDVGDEYATDHWLAHHSTRWHQDKLRQDMEEQRLEIMKHKWIESEKIGNDMGKKAALDWISKYAKRWRQWKDSQEKES